MEEQACITFKNITLYAHHQLVLHRANFEVPQGSLICLEGATGTGKTSILKSIIAAILPSDGNLTVLRDQWGKEGPSDIAFLRRKLGLVAAYYPLIEELTVEENLLFVLKVTDWVGHTQRKVRVDQVLDLVRATHFKHKRIEELNKEEYLCAQIARALLHQPPALLLDEPFAVLNDQEKQRWLDFFQRFSKNTHTTTLITATNFDKVSATDHVFYYKIEQGDIVAK